MCAMDRRFVDGFTTGQKVVLQAVFVAVLAVAVVAVFRHSTLWGWIYLGFVTVGQAVLVLPALCGHCPYPRRYDDCLLAPASLMRRVVPDRGPRLSGLDRAALFAGVAGLVGIPQYWLFQEPLLLFLFWALLLPFLGFFQLHLCRHCRHTGCPANRT